MNNNDTKELVLEEDQAVAETGSPCKVILYNDEWHSFEEVIAQLIKAINCTTRRAEEITWEVHTKGKSCVFEGELADCLRVSAVLEEISLNTQIEM